MTWIRWDSDAPDDPLWALMGDELKVDPMHAMGCHNAVSCRVAKHRPDGLISEVPDSVLEQWAGWRGRRGRFAAILRKHCQREDGSLGGWWRNEAHIRKQKKDAARPGEGTRKARAGASERPAGAKQKGPPRARGGNGTVRYGTEISEGKDPNSPPVGGADAPAAQSANWVSAAAEIQLEVAHSVMTKPGLFGKEVKPLVEAFGEERVLAVWRKACATVPAEKLRYFATDYPTHAKSLDFRVYDDDGNYTPEALEAMGPVR